MQYFNNNYNNYNRGGGGYGNDYGASSFNLRSSESSSVPSIIQVNDQSREKKFPKKYIASHAVLFVLVNVVVIILQIGMSLTNALFSSVGIGYWAGAYNVVIGILIFGCLKYSDNFYFVAGLLALNILAFFLSLIALVSMSAYAISFYDNCTAQSDLKEAYCLTLTRNSKGLFWAMLAFGIVSTILSGVFVLVFANVVNRAYTKWSTKKRLSFIT